MQAQLVHWGGSACCPLGLRGNGLPGLKRRVAGNGRLNRSNGLNFPAQTRRQFLTYAVASYRETEKGNDNDRRVFVIPLDFYRILKARRINSTEILKRSYENLLRSPPRVGYSDSTLNSRAKILKMAADCMLDSDQRREYDQRCATTGVPTIKVKPSDFPGALAVLQEAGEMERVVEFGSQWLRENTSNPVARDVALAVALAYCDLASETLAKGQGVAMCCEELEAALDLLTACGVAAQLQEDVAGALKELRPQYILEQLALPDDAENQDKREKGLAQLKELIWEIDAEGNLSPILQDREAFIQTARMYLSAAQQIELHQSAPNNVTIPMDELYDTALAYVAEGYKKKWPQHILMAEKVLQKIQVTSMTSSFEGMDVSVEMGLCALMLGETEKAMNYLGLTPGSSKLPDEDVVKFVQANSADPEDMLPGVCALAERWLKETIIPNYREMNVMTSSLGEWFQSPRVSVYLQVLERGKELNLLSAAAAAMKISSSVARGITSAVTSAVSGVRGILTKKSKKTVTPGREMRMDPDTVGRLKLPRVTLPKTTNVESRHSNGSNGAVHRGRGEELQSRVPSVLDDEPTVSFKKEEEGTEGPSSTPPRENGAEDWWEASGEDIYPEVQKEEKSRDDKLTVLWARAWFKAAVAGGLVLAFAAVGCFIGNQNSYPTDGSASSNPMRRFVNSVSDMLSTTSGTLDVPLAEELVRRWHGIKSEALGVQHAIDDLADVLEGSMLKQWRDRAQYVKKDGWHWQYRLLDLSVDSVSVSRDGRRAHVAAHIKEKAELIDQGRKADWYSTSYTVQYELAMRKQGWKISSARVVYQS